MAESSDEACPKITSVSKKRLTELDALRGLAAICVVLYHYCHRYKAKYEVSDITLLHDFWWGCYGVQIFFILSGFVIYLSLERTKHLRDFVASRFTRLYPTYWAGMIVTLIVIKGLSLPGWNLTWSEIAANTTMFQTFMGQPHVDGAYWSLTEELKFYGLMGLFSSIGLISRPLAICLIWLLTAALAYATQSLCTGNIELVAKIVSVLISVSYCYWFTTGIGLYKLHQDPKDKQGYNILLASAAYALLISGRPALFAICVAIFWICVFLRPTILRLAPLGFLGAISYPLYVVHQNVGYCILFLVRERIGFLPAVAMALITVILLAYIIHTRIEKPSGSYLKERYRRWRDSEKILNKQVVS
jgi:peptidoglycan/LPS O-acetylase OafA/YrhL